MMSKRFSAACLTALTLTLGCGYDSPEQDIFASDSAIVNEGGDSLTDTPAINNNTIIDESEALQAGNLLPVDASGASAVASLLEGKSILFAGQSNAAAAPQPGFEEDARRYTVPGALTWDGNWVQAEPSISGSIQPGIGVLAGAFTFMLDSEHDITPRLIGRPWPGAAIKLMLPDTPHYSAMREDVYDGGFEPAILLWHQGESDGIIGTSEEDYEESLDLLVDQWFVDYPTLEYVLLFQIAEGACGASQKGIRAAQKRVANNHANVLLVNTDFLPEDARYDGCHYNLSGYDRHARAALKALELALD